MKPYRQWISKFLTTIGFIAFVFVGAFLWDHNERNYDEKMMSALIFDCLQTFNQDGDPGAIIFPYVGSTKTKVFHTFVSDCAREIRSTQLTGFDSTEDALKAGYSQCTVCKP